MEVFNEEDGSLNRTYDILDETPTYYRLIKTDISKEYTVANRVCFIPKIVGFMRVTFIITCFMME